MDPVFKKEQLCVMSMQTWADFGTLVESQKRTLKAQDKVIKDLTAANGALAAQLNDVKERLENLRSAYREMKRAQLSKDNPQLAEADKEPFIANGGSEPISYI
jgi:predicted RNase H-like nuclease (RuvC/YqgF family)